MQRIRAGDIDPSFVITHRMHALDDAPRGDQMFRDNKTTAKSRPVPLIRDEYDRTAGEWEQRKEHAGDEPGRPIRPARKTTSR
jgi:hypothetical protein